LLFAFASSAVFMIILWRIADAANGQMNSTQLTWSLSWLAATVLIVLAVFWRLTMPPPEKDLGIPQQTQVAVSTNQQQSGGPNVGEAQVLATMIASQDHTTWLAFTLGMTSEVLLVNGFFLDTPLSRFLWVFPLGGILLAGVLWNMILRSNADMGALYENADTRWKHIFHIPGGRRRGASAGLVMNVAFGGWIVAWVIALAFFLNHAI
jgi:hypothetical protein